MAAPSYTEDLTDIDLAEAVGNYVALGGGGAGLSADPDFAIQGTNSITKQVQTARKGIAFNNGSGITIPAGDHVFVWIYCTTPGLLEARSVGGLCVTIGNATTDRNEFHIFGATEYATGGWYCIPIKYVTTASGSHPYRTLVGTPAGDPQYFGIIADMTDTIKAVNTSVDAMRYGTGAYITAGEVGTPATFTGFAAANDASSARWGILTAISGGYSLQGRFVVGQDNSQTPTETYFDDSNALIVLADTFHSETDFTQIIVDHASTTFNMTNITVLALGTNNPGRLIFNNASTTSALTNCTFDSIGITTLEAGVTATNCTWRGSDQITQNAASMLGCNVLTSTVAADDGALLYDENVDPDGILDGMTFTKGPNDHHAIRFGVNVPATMTLRNCTFNGFSSDADVNGSVFRFDDSNQDITLSLVDCSTDGAFSVDDAALSPQEVTIVIDPVTTLVNVKDNNGDNLVDVMVFMKAANGDGDLPFEEVVTSITRVTTTATVAHTAHGLNTNEYVKLAGITDKTEDNNGAHQITKIDVDSYSYTTTDSGSENYAGTITSTGALLYDLTAANGNISSARTLTLSQPLEGFARKSSGSPRFKTFALAGTVNNSTGLTINVRLILDE